MSPATYAYDLTRPRLDQHSVTRRQPTVGALKLLHRCLPELSPAPLPPPPSSLPRLSQKHEHQEQKQQPLPAAPRVYQRESSATLWRVSSQAPPIAVKRPSRVGPTLRRRTRRLLHRRLSRTYSHATLLILAVLSLRSKAHMFVHQ